jgi:hypothetical protein
MSSKPEEPKQKPLDQPIPKSRSQQQQDPLQKPLDSFPIPRQRSVDAQQLPKQRSLDNYPVPKQRSVDKDDASGGNDKRNKSTRPQNLSLLSGESSEEGSEKQQQQQQGLDVSKSKPPMTTTPGVISMTLTMTNVSTNVTVVPTALAAAAAGEKKKPSALDRVDVGEFESDRCQSPSRRSPRSPPRSPSWMRYHRESPPRSPPIRVMSPPKSPTERFPAAFSDCDDARRDEFHYPEVPHPEDDIAPGMEKPPPKPARQMPPGNGGPEQYDAFEDAKNVATHNVMAANALDLASFAATVASDTAHLTNMSVSPTNLPHHHPHQPAYDPDAGSGSGSPPSPNYYEECDDIEVADPTPKNIDYQNSKRQKVRPPTTDWSPITDLSPILDVSPSVERLEQEKMLAEQIRQYQEGGEEVPPELLEEHEAMRRRAEEMRQGRELTSPLRRFGNFEDLAGIAAGHIDPRMIHSRDTPKNTEKDKPRRQDYRGHQYFEEDPEIDLDDDIPPPQRRVDPKDSVPLALRRNLPEPSAESKQKIPSPKPRGQNMAPPTQHTTPPTRSPAHPDSSHPNGKPKPAAIDLQQADSDQYHVLTSPVSPGSKIHRDYSHAKEASPPVSLKEKEYMYPSPVTPPSPSMSPPRPGSPSLARVHHDDLPQRPHSSQGLTTPHQPVQVSRQFPVLLSLSVTVVSLHFQVLFQVQVLKFIDYKQCRSLSSE